MNRKYALALAATLALGLFAVVPASAQTQLLNLQQDVPMSATLDNPCTASPEAILFTGTLHLDQQVWLMPGGTTRLIVAESTTVTGKDTLLGLMSPTYTAAGSNSVDAEFNPGAATIDNYNQVVSSASQDNFHVIVSLDFDPASLRINPSLRAECGDGSPQ